jgi:oxygen-independent coproporphyrinogen-3 oxidase
LRSAGVTRLSIGVQCLDDQLLSVLGRSHTAADARTTVEKATRIGFASVGVDILYGIPGLRTSELSRWIQELAGLGVRHFSAYSLELHPGTPLADEGFMPAEPLEEEAHWLTLTEEFARAGFEIYEVSNFACPDSRCRHNLAYWNRSAYLGLGPGAHSFDPESRPWGGRSWNAPDLTRYGKHLRRGCLPPGDGETLDREQALLEALFLALRRAEPLDGESLCREFSLDESLCGKTLGALQGQGYGRVGSGGTYVPTLSGLRRADGLALQVHDRLLSPSDETACRPRGWSGRLPSGRVALTNREGLVTVGT